MCFYFRQSVTARELRHRFRANFGDENAYHPGVYNGFQFPEAPVITNEEPGEIQLFRWGLIPHWAKDKDIRKYTLNARIETINEKPSFRDAAVNRCLIPADGFYEWQWLDPKGRNKQKYLLTLPDSELFAFAGLWSRWTDRSTGEVQCTFTILTTEAAGLMRKIHNTKKRMPVILSPDSERDWLREGNLKMQNDRLMAIAE